MVEVVQWTDTISLGAAIISVLVGLSTLIFFFYGVRYRTLLKLEKENSESLKEGREAFKLKAERLEHELDVFTEEQREIRHTLKTELAAERAKTDLTGLMKMQKEQHDLMLNTMSAVGTASLEEMREQLLAQEERHIARNEALVKVLMQVRDAIVKSNGVRKR